MKTYIRNTHQELEALGFRYSEDQSERGKRAYWHPYEPDTILRLWDGASQAACLTIMRKAHTIAGLANRGPKMPTTLKERAELQRAQQRARANRERLAYEERAANRDLLEEGERQRLALHSISQQLMGAGRPRAF